MNKKCTTYIITIVLALGMCSCTNEKSLSQPIQINLDAKFEGYSTLEQLETDSPLIVKGVKVAEDEPIIKTENGLVVMCYTLSDFRITEIFKDDTKDFALNDTVKIFENEAYDKNENIIYHIAGYEKMVKEDEYLLFLRKSKTDNCYIPVGIVFGKVELSDFAITENTNTDGLENELSIVIISGLGQHQYAFEHHQFTS